MSASNDYLSEFSRKRPDCVISGMYSHLIKRGSDQVINLGAGSPNPETFPIHQMKLTLNNGEELTLDKATTQQALQYQQGQGLPQLLPMLRHMQKRFHDRDLEDGKCDLVVIPGVQDGLYKAIGMLMNEGEAVLLEEFVYSSLITLLDPYHPEYLVVQSDDEGMVPESLEKVLEDREGKKKPKFMYMNPCGSNPTGTVIPLQRRKRIYDLCCRHDIIILEDDPYFFLHFDDSQRVPSFFSLDKDQRVIRFDSFSKILSSGMRIGFVSGPKIFLENILKHMQASVLQASSLSQAVVYTLLSHWGDSGFDAHVANVRSTYEINRDIMQKAVEKHLTNLCQWKKPRAGMFFWLKVLGVSDTWDMIMDRGLSSGIVLIPGRCFASTKSDMCPYVRASFSMVKEDNVDEAFARLAELNRNEQKIAKST